MGLEIRLERLSKGFPGPDGARQSVVAELDVCCAAGQVLRIEGASGAGKSTLLNMVSGLLLPDEGQVWIGTERIDRAPESLRDRFRATHVGTIYQTFNLIGPLTALENLVVPQRLAGRHRPGAAERARQLLEELGLGRHLAKRPHELSVGQRQRVAVARALLQEPDVLLADEPTASLDPEATEAVVAMLVRMHARGTTLVLVSHDPTVREALPGPSVVLGREGAPS
jgi:putative ABC transport system ATP-binding protein